MKAKKRPAEILNRLILEKARETELDGMKLDEQVLGEFAEKRKAAEKARCAPKQPRK